MIMCIDLYRRHKPCITPQVAQNIHTLEKGDAFFLFVPYLIFPPKTFLTNCPNLV